jgi:uncharacterized damage-inducible protein DinB
MKHLLVTFVAVALPVLASAFTPPVRPSTQAQLVADWERAKAFTKEYLDAMPEDGLAFKPTPDVRSFAEQMAHLANANFGFTAQVSGKANPYQGQNLEKMDAIKTKAGLDKMVLESYDFVISALKGMTDAQLGESAKLFGRDLTREVAFQKAFEHQTHHRGQTTVYLRLKGVKPPNEKLF